MEPIRLTPARPAWALCLLQSSWERLGDFRLETGFRVREEGDRLWLQGPSFSSALERRLLALPALERHQITADGNLLPRGTRLHLGALPQEGWMPLDRWLELRPATPSSSTLRQLEPVRVRVVGSDRETEPSLLLTDMDTWKDYAVRAPAIRLDPLRFAAASDSRVVIQGTPLPAVRGVRYVERDGVAVPCGFRWEPAVAAGVLRTRAGTGPGDLLLLSRDGSMEIIPEEWIIPVTRSAVRITAASLTTATAEPGIILEGDEDE